MSGTNEKRVEKGNRENGVGSENNLIEIANVAVELVGKERNLEQRGTGV